MCFVTKKASLCVDDIRKCCAVPRQEDSFPNALFTLSKLSMLFTNTGLRHKLLRGEISFKILLELCEHATVEVGRQENSIASSKSTRPSSELNVFFCSWKRKGQKRRRKKQIVSKMVITFKNEWRKKYLKIEAQKCEAVNISDEWKMFGITWQ